MHATTNEDVRDLSNDEQSQPVGEIGVVAGSPRNPYRRCSDAALGGAAVDLCLRLGEVLDRKHLLIG